MNKEIRPRICVVTYPRPTASIVPLSNLVDILNNRSSFLYLITGNDGASILKTHPTIKGCSIIYKSRSFIFAKIIGHIGLQVRIAYEIMRVNKNVDLYVFFMGDSLVLPALISKISRKSLIWIIAGSVKNIFVNNDSLLPKLFALEEKINYYLANKIIIYSAKIIEEWDLKKYKNKIQIAHEHFLDFTLFKTHAQLTDKDNLIGYIGRLSEEKGTLNFIKAIPGILKERCETNFLIGGDGQLRGEIENYLKDQNLNEKVKITGWISHENLPQYFNKLKLIVLPSYTEGIPNIMLEAMACG